MDGSNIALLNIIKGMIARGHEVAVVTSSLDGPMLVELDRCGVLYSKANLFMTIYPLNKNPLLYIPRILYIMYRQHLGRRSVEEMIERFKPDIVHTNVGPLAIGYEACKRAKIPHVWHQREYLDKIGMNFFPSNSEFRKKTKVDWNYNICITKGVFDHWKFRKNKDVVIYDGIFDEHILANIPSRCPEKSVLFVGRIEESKGVYELIRAFDDFRQTYPEYVLKIIGSTSPDSVWYYNQCVDYVQKHHLQESVLFLGRQDNVYQHMSKAGMLVMSSEFEGFGFVTAEAMACGCPVIGKATTGTKEQMENGMKHTGHEIGLQYTTTDELVEAMYSVVNMDTTEMCRLAKETVIDLYSIEGNVTNIERFYNKILKNY